MDGSVSIDCPHCNGVHTYLARELEPWPPQPGDTRTVPCRHAEYVREKAAEGNPAAARLLYWEPPATHINITF